MEEDLKKMIVVIFIDWMVLLFLNLNNFFVFLCLLVICLWVNWIFL